MRESPLDYIEISNGKDVLDAVTRLKADPALYAAMGLTRSLRAKMSGWKD